jgi:hypothetical protein
MVQLRGTFCETKNKKIVCYWNIDWMDVTDVCEGGAHIKNILRVITLIYQGTSEAITQAKRGQWAKILKLL